MRYKQRKFKKYFKENCFLIWVFFIAAKTQKQNRLEKQCDDERRADMKRFLTLVRQYTNVSIHYSDAEAARERSRIYYHLEPTAEEYRQKLEEEYERVTLGVRRFLEFGQS
jgi:hypothetical protein